MQVAAAEERDVARVSEMRKKRNYADFWVSLGCGQYLECGVAAIWMHACTCFCACTRVYACLAILKYLHPMCACMCVLHFA